MLDAKKRETHLRIPVLPMFMFFVTLCLCVEFVRAEELIIPEDQSSEISQGAETPVINKANEEGELTRIDSEGQPDSAAKEDTTPSAPPGDEKPEEYNGNLVSEAPSIKDPLQSYNRAIFVFNDKTYYYFMKPIYTGYSSVVPEKARISVRNFFTNITMPVRYFNCIFQGKVDDAGIELARFLINSTIGIGGLFDPAKSILHLQKQERDFGQTLAKYNVKPGIYIVWPFLGPSTVRDTVGLAGDAALNPLSWISYFFLTLPQGVGSYAYNTVNDVSLDKGKTYESVTKPAIDPYIALQDAYVQNRIKKNQK